MHVNVSEKAKRKHLAIAIVLAGFLLLFLFTRASADSSIARFVFITEPQTIQRGELSGDLTIQAQDNQGNSHATDETIDMEFSSTSSTGEFLSSAGEPVRTVMNKGTANRTFYYRDTSLGRYTLTVKATGRVSGDSWTTNQEIVVGSEKTSVPVVSSSPSAPTAPRTEVAAGPRLPAIEAFAGEDRVIPVGTEMELTGSAVGFTKEPITNARFWWNFGDGETGEGKTIGHIFRSLGTYVVVLHVSSGDYAASDYLSVEVVPNQIAIGSVVAGSEGYIRLENGSDIATDIGGWILEDDRAGRFYIPVRTVIGAHAVAAFANHVTRLSPEWRTLLRRPDETVAVLWNMQSMPAKNQEIPTLAKPAVSRMPEKPQEPAPMHTADISDETPAAPASAVRTEAAAVGVSPRSFSPPPIPMFGVALILSTGGAIGFFCLRRIIS